MSTHSSAQRHAPGCARPHRPARTSHAAYAALATGLLLASASGASGAAGSSALERPPDRSSPPREGAIPPFNVTLPRVLQLEHGLRVWHVERRRAPLVDVVAVVDAGASADPPALPGLAAFTSAMLEEGAGSLDAIAFANAVESLGAQVNTFAGAESAGASLHVEASRFPAALALFADVLVRPRLAEADWGRVRQQLAGELRVQAQEPQALARLAAQRAAWGPQHRFGQNLDGTPAALLAVTPSDVQRFHRARYRPDATTLVVVGAIDAATLSREVDRVFGGWLRDGVAPDGPKLASPLPRAGRQLVTVHVPAAAQTVLRVVQPAPPEILPWTPAVEVMNTLLGGSFTSRLNNNLREEHGYSYGAGSSFDLRRAGNLFVVRTSVATPVTAPAVQEILRELQRMREPASLEEVSRARGVAALTLPSQFDNGSSIASLWASIAARGLEPGRLAGFMAAAAAVGPEGVQEAARSTIKPDDVIVVAVGDMEVVGADLAAVGPRTALTPAALLPGLEALEQLGAP